VPLFSFWVPLGKCGTIFLVSGYFAFRLGNKGRAVIPAALRAQARLSEGETLLARVDEQGRVVIETREAIKLRLRHQAALAKADGGVVERLLADRRADIEIEEKHKAPRTKRVRTSKA
jgi:bifunctional DNA-binding transcriptional regulator/antitoxin component of YhaV-PrlF toxin-antitoxin module